MGWRKGGDIYNTANDKDLKKKRERLLHADPGPCGRLAPLLTCLMLSPLLPSVEAPRAGTVHIFLVTWDTVRMSLSCGNESL